MSTGTNPNNLLERTVHLIRKLQQRSGTGPFNPPELLEQLMSDMLKQLEPERSKSTSTPVSMPDQLINRLEMIGNWSVNTGDPLFLNQLYYGDDGDHQSGDDRPVGGVGDSR